LRGHPNVCHIRWTEPGQYPGFLLSPPPLPPPLPVSQHRHTHLCSFVPPTSLGRACSTARHTTAQHGGISSAPHRHLDHKRSSVCSTHQRRAQTPHISPWVDQASRLDTTHMHSCATFSAVGHVGQPFSQLLVMLVNLLVSCWSCWSTSL
jgi:hypothetical protein